MNRSPLSIFLAGVLATCLACAPMIAAADDIDLFTGASGGTPANPRILILLDNTSNWSRQSQKWPIGATQGQSEANAIKTVLAEQDGAVSLALMEFVTGGNANDTGGFIRYAMRPMNPANKTAFTTQLATIYDNINTPAEKLNSNMPYGDLMYDAYNYFAGLNAVSPSAVLASKADNAGYTAPYTRFASPLTADNTCGKSFVILIGNADSSGPVSDSAANTANLNRLWNNRDASGQLLAMPQLGLPNFTSTSTKTDTAVGHTAACYAKAKDAETELASFAACSSFTDGCKIGAAVAGAPAAGGTCARNASLYSVVGTDTVLATTPTGTASTDTGPRNADEWAKLLHDRGIPVAGTTTQPSVTTYTIDVYNAQPNATQTALLMSMAKAGGGKYFAARNEQAIADALRQILTEILAVNSTFASVALPVNAGNHSQSENQVFIAMFRPDPGARPRWFGNVKRYQLITSGADIDLGDVNGKPAINPLTGFVTPCATSYWSSDSGAYWSGLGVSPDPAGTCGIGGFNKYSDAPDGPFAEKGAAAQILRMGNTGAGAPASQAVNRNVLTLAGTSLAPLTAANAGLDANLVRFIRGEDVNNEKGNGQLTATRPSIHGDVIHSRPLPVNYGTSKGVTVYYGANDGTLRALNAATGVERWAFVAPEFLSRLARLKDNSPLVAYPGLPAGITPAPARKDYFFDGSIGLYQNADNSQTWIYPVMRRGGRMIYSLDVSDPDTPLFKWKAGCPNLGDNTGCTAGMESIGQTWSTPNVAFIKGYSSTRPVLVVGGGYDRCEDADSPAPACSTTTGGAIYILDAADGSVLRTFPIERAVAADVGMVDVDNDGMPDYAYAADLGGALYRVDFVAGTAAPRLPAAPASWNVRTIARTSGGGRKFLFAPALMAVQDQVYVAIGSGDREHPLYEQYPYANVVNRFYVLRDDLAGAPGSPAKDLDALADYSGANNCATPPVLPGSSLSGWFMDLGDAGQGEQVVTSALIAGGMVTFNTNRPIPPQSGTCSTALGEARGYWVNLVNGAGAIGTPAACGGARSSPFVNGGMPPTPVLANGVSIDGKATTVVIGAVQKGGTGAAGTSVAISPQKLRPPLRSRRTRVYSYTWSD
jgi:type IV pilus assembly protein PilY1